ncbi:MAG: bpX6 domain-containing protein [Polyangiales bacterium]
MSVRPWRLAHRGTVPVTGVLLARRDDPAGAARRAMDAWCRGCEVLDLGAAWAVLWPTPRALRADALPGAPLVTLRRADGVSLRSAIPLQPREIDALLGGGARAGDLVLAVGAVAAVHSAAGAPRVDLAAFLDPGAVDLAAEVTSLGDPPAMPRVRIELSGERPWCAKVTGGARATALQAAATAQAAGEEVVSLPWWMRLVVWLRARCAPGSRALPAPVDAPEEADAPTGGARVARPPPGPPPSTWWARVVAQAAKSLWGARLEKYLGARQAKYLHEVMEMFEEGDLHEALRRAVPLGGNDPAGVEKPLSWSIPRPRDALDIRLAPVSTQTAASPPDLHARLTSLYRDAVERLEAEGRAEEAAFVLAELLREPEAAVSLLERHGRLEAAAALADRARMSAEVRVRQWMRAGDRARAFALARRHRCYEAAATLLAGDAPELASWLRAEHARHLARTGDFVAAVKAGERVPEMRDEVLGWMDALIARGGPDAARALPSRLVADEGAFDAVRARVLALCAAPDARVERWALARALDAALRAQRSAGLDALARPVIRALVRDAAQRGDPEEAAFVPQFAQRVADLALAADLPRWPTFTREPLEGLRATPGSEPRAAHAIERGDVGLRAVEDLARLPDGRVLLAMGESGAELWSRGGRLLRRFDEPCARLVISDHGDRALALAPRGTFWRAAVLEPDTGAARPWGDLRVDAWTDDFDGDAWPVSMGGQVLELDAADASPSVFRVLAEAPAGEGISAQALAMQRAPEALAALGWMRDARRGDAHATQHVWSPATGAVRQGRALDVITDASTRPEVFAVDAGRHRVLRADRVEGARWRLTVILQATRAHWPLDGEVFAVCARMGWTCVLARVDDGVAATLYNPHDAPCLRVLLHRATRAVARLQGGWLLLADDLGRVRVMDLAFGGTALDLRV